MQQYLLNTIQMAFNKEQFKTIKGIFLTVNGKDYQSDYSYNKNIDVSKNYTVSFSHQTMPA